MYKRQVLIQTPVYSEFYDVTESWGREVVESPLKEQDGRWIIDFEDFEEKAKEAKVFFLCSPHNPLGIVWTREELERMCHICIANNVLIVSDEIHSDPVSYTHLGPFLQHRGQVCGGDCGIRPVSPVHGCF